MEPVIRPSLKGPINFLEKCNFTKNISVSFMIKYGLFLNCMCIYKKKKNKDILIY